MKRKAIAFVTAGILALGTLGASGEEQTFVDMPTNWATEHLQFAVDYGLMGGMVEGGKNYIKPNGNLTRAQAAAILNNALYTIEEDELVGVTDVPAGQWYTEHMAKAVASGIFEKAAKMRPNANITREEVFAAVANGYGLADDADQTILNNFTDLGTISAANKAKVAAMLQAGYIKGTGNKLNPKGNLTRAEFAAIMHNIYSSSGV